MHKRRKSRGPTLSRRSVLAGIAGSGVALTGGGAAGARELLATGAGAGLSGAADGPDVVLITLDDLPPGFIGYYQDKVGIAYGGATSTPEFDALFAASWTSSSARANVPVCFGSRSSFLAAASPEEIGVFGDEPWAGNPALLQEFLDGVSSGALTTLPGFATGRGISTSVRGKVDHSGLLFDIPGQVESAGTFTRLADYLNDLEYAPSGVMADDLSYMPSAVLPDNVVHFDELRTNELIQRINEPYTGQRFDMIGLGLAHTPRTVHQVWWDLFPLEEIELMATLPEVYADVVDIPQRHLDIMHGYYWPGGLNRFEWLASLGDAAMARHVRAMLASVAHCSYQVGRIHDALEATGRDYHLVVTSDHGYHLGEKMKYAKKTLYDQSLLVPATIYSSTPHPRFPVGNTTHPIDLLGLARTIADLLGIPTVDMPAQWQGMPWDITGQCTKSTLGVDETTASRALVFETKAGATLKIIVHPGDASELYDLTADPAEFDNLLVPNPPAGLALADAGQRAEMLAGAEAELVDRARTLEQGVDWFADPVRRDLVERWLRTR
jgi:arylsulfatase A-like enzyme